MRGGGLGTPAARLVFLFVWVCGLVLGFIDEQFSPLDPLNATAYLGALLGILILTTPGEQALRLPRALLLPVLSLYVTAVALFQSPEVKNVVAVTFAVYLVAFMIPRGNAVAGGIGSGLVIGCAVAWALSREATGMELAGLIGVPIGCVVAGIVWRVVLQRIIRAERRYQEAAFLSRDREAAARDAVQVSRHELLSIRHEVSPLLERIVVGQEVDEEARAALVGIEGGIRDRLRAPHLQHPELVAAVAALRTRGSTVVMLGEPRPARDIIAPGLARSIVAALEGWRGGRVTIRSHPAGRDVAVSVVLSSTERTEQLIFSEDGVLTGRG